MEVFFPMQSGLSFQWDRGVHECWQCSFNLHNWTLFLKRHAWVSFVLPRDALRTYCMELCHMTTIWFILTDWLYSRCTSTTTSIFWRTLSSWSTLTGHTARSGSCWFSQSHCRTLRTSRWSSPTSSSAPCSSCPTTTVSSRPRRVSLEAACLLSLLVLLLLLLAAKQRIRNAGCCKMCI